MRNYWLPLMLLRALVSLFAPGIGSGAGDLNHDRALTDDWNLLEEVEYVGQTDTAALTTTNNDFVHQLVWDPTSANELVQSRSMVRTSPDAYSTPVPVWAATDRRRDVVAMYAELLGMTRFARVRYSPYGVPEPVLVGDLNHDGVLSNEDRAFVGVALNSAQPTGEILMADPAWTPEEGVPVGRLAS